MVRSSLLSTFTTIYRKSVSINLYHTSCRFKGLTREKSQVPSVDARNSRYSEYRSKMCQMCGRSVDETVLPVVLEYKKYGGEKKKII